MKIFFQILQNILFIFVITILYTNFAYTDNLVIFCFLTMFYSTYVLKNMANAQLRIKDTAITVDYLIDVRSKLKIKKPYNYKEDYTKVLELIKKNDKEFIIELISSAIVWIISWFFIIATL